MAKTDLLAHVLPSEGWYCVMSLKSDALPEQKFVKTLEEVDSLADRMCAEKRNVYFGCAKFRSATSREKTNAAYFKAFWIDIDCGDKKPYPTQQDALDALEKFCNKFALPEPTLVNSGRGVHAYWTLTESIEVDRWEVVAERLKQLCLGDGLHIDPTVTADCARILRIPETFNFKDVDNPLPVSVIRLGEHTQYETLKNLIGATTPAKQEEEFIPPQSSALTLSLVNNITSSFKKILQRSSSDDGCAQIEYAVTHQADTPEPLWRGVLSIANLCEDREKAIHIVSQGHPKYDPNETDRKARLTKGPYTCEVFKKNNPDLCANCPHNGKIKSPIVLGQDIARAEEPKPVEESGEEAPQPVLSPLPWPYFRGKNGGIYIEAAGEGEKPEVVYEHDLTLVKRMIDPTLGECAWLRRTLPRDGIKEFSMPMSAMTSKEEMRKALPTNGILGSAKQLEKITNYLIRVAKEMQLEKKAEQMRVQFGWTEENNKIIVGDREISVSGISYSPPSSTTKSEAGKMIAVGSFSKWKDIFNTYAMPGFETHAFTTLTAFGAPLMKFLNIKGCAINLINNNSGTGKSTVLHMMNSVIGHPEDLCLQWKDTYHTIIYKLGIMNNFAVGIDEVTKMNAEVLSDLLYSVTQGRGKDRMKASTNEMRVNHTKWALPIVTTSNSSVRDKIASLKSTYDGEMMRLMEFRIDLTDNIPKEKAAEIFGALYENYGHAADIYCSYLVQNRDKCIELVRKVQYKLDKDIGFQSRERFWSAQAACNIAGGLIAQSLGLHDYDMQKVYQWAVEELTGMRNNNVAPVVSPAVVIGEFINLHMMNTLVVNGNMDSRTNLHSMPIMEPRGPLICRFEPDTNLLFVGAKNFKEYCSKQQITYDDLLRQMAEEGLFRGTIRKRMTKGSKMVGAPVHALMIDCSKGGFVNVEDYIAKQEPATV